MKRFCCLAALMLLSSSADAGHSFSFRLGGHRVHIAAQRHCFFRSCIRVSIPGIHDGRRRRDRLDDIDDTPVATPAPAAVEPVSSRIVATPPGKPAVETVTSVAAPTTVGLAASTSKAAVAPPAAVQQPPRTEPSRTEAASTAPPAVEPPRAETPAERPVAQVPRVSTVSQQAETESLETPLGDWQTEGKGSVRIERCGSALCGYVIDPSTGAKGEAVLVNMKLKTGSQWTGNVYSNNSGDSYYGTLAMKGPYTLRVEACALGRFYCSGNNWSRIETRPDRLVSSRQNASASGS